MSHLSEDTSEFHQFHNENAGNENSKFGKVDIKGQEPNSVGQEEKVSGKLDDQTENETASDKMDTATEECESPLKHQPLKEIQQNQSSRDFILERYFTEYKTHKPRTLEKEVRKRRHRSSSSPKRKCPRIPLPKDNNTPTSRKSSQLCNVDENIHDTPSTVRRPEMNKASNWNGKGHIDEEQSQNTEELNAEDKFGPFTASKPPRHWNEEQIERMESSKRKSWATFWTNMNYLENSKSRQTPSDQDKLNDEEMLAFDRAQLAIIRYKAIKINSSEDTSSALRDPVMGAIEAAQRKLNRFKKKLKSSDVRESEVTREVTENVRAEVHKGAESEFIIQAVPHKNVKCPRDIDHIGNNNAEVLMVAGREERSKKHMDHFKKQITITNKEYNYRTGDGDDDDDDDADDDGNDVYGGTKYGRGKEWSENELLAIQRAKKDLKRYRREIEERNEADIVSTNNKFSGTNQSMQLPERRSKRVRMEQLDDNEGPNCLRKERYSGLLEEEDYSGTNFNDRQFSGDLFDINREYSSPKGKEGQRETLMEFDELISAQCDKDDGQYTGKTIQSNVDGTKPQQSGKDSDGDPIQLIQGKKCEALSYRISRELEGGVQYHSTSNTKKLNVSRVESGRISKVRRHSFAEGYSRKVTNENVEEGHEKVEVNKASKNVNQNESHTTGATSVNRKVDSNEETTSKKVRSPKPGIRRNNARNKRIQEERCGVETRSCRANEKRKRHREYK